MTNYENTLRKAPLFVGAILFSLGIFFQKDLVFQISPHDVSNQILANSQTQLIKGVIVSEIDKRKTFYGDESHSFVIEAESIAVSEEDEKNRVSGKAKTYLINPTKDLSYGDQVSFWGKLVSPKGVRNPGGF